MRSNRALLALLTTTLSACATARTAEVSHAIDAAAGVTHAELAQLLTEHWEHVMKSEPLWATRLGDHRYDDQIADRSFAAREAEKSTRRAFRDRAQALSGLALDLRDQTTLALFIGMLDSQIATEVCESPEWSLSARRNSIVEWNELAELHPVKTAADAANYGARLKSAARAIDVEIDNLKRGAARGAFANAESTRRVLAMVKTQLGQKVEEWPMYAPMVTFDAAATAALLENELRPAFQRYADFLEKEILPKARDDSKPGLASLPFGSACYAAQIAHHTTLSPAPEAAVLHELGKSEIARINAEMKVLGEKLFQTADLPQILAKLRSDASLHFSSGEEIEEKAKRALDAARAKMVDYFGILPKADCIVSRIPDYEAPFTTVAYYRQPVPDGSKPGQYFINVYKPETRTRYEAEALAFHESIPGHHLQIAIAQELPALPAFRKHGGVTAFVEGWALYTEQLAEEMKLYSGDLDRMGKLSYEAWRASRLVVDTGLHAMGWSREQAKQYMMEHTALAANNIDNEVDRYIVWPGQALAYKTGQLEISRLRAEAEKTLGAAFDIKQFHDVVLGGGAVSLPVLQRRVAEWIAARKAS